MYDCIVIGAGAVGSLISRELSKYTLKTLLIEKENDVCNVTSMANSAIVHSGYDPVPGTKKALFNVEGNKLYDQLAEDLDFSFRRIGSLTIGFNDEDLETLKDLQKRSMENGVEVQILNQEELRKLEPNISPEATCALFAPTAGIVDPFNMVAHAAENAVDNGVILHLGEEVIDIKKVDDTYLVITNKDQYETKCVINAAGLYSDKITSMVSNISWSITPRKGEYYVLDHFPGLFIKHTLFPLPSKKGKGILITPTTSGNYLVGPSSEVVDDKEDLSTDKLTLDAVKKSALRLCPNIPFKEQIRVFAGLRATPSTHDFIIEEDKDNLGFFICGGIESPGLASSPYIAKYVVEELVSKRLKLVKNESFNPKVRKYLRMKYLMDDQKDKVIKENKEYGVIICGCEQISLGEINDIFSRSIPVKTIKGFKKRLRSGFGKCQGGFCQAYLVSLIAKNYHMSKLDVLYDEENSNILLEKARRDD